MHPAHNAPSAQSASSAAPLLATKLYIPAPRPQLIPRPRLVERVQAGLLGKLTLISAPAGFGKTTLLATWLRQNEKLKIENAKLKKEATERSQFSIFNSQFRVVWVSLDAADADPLRFWSYVIAALDSLQPDSGTTALALLQSPQPPPIETVLTPLLNALSTLPTDAVLILDDYHLIDAPQIHSTLAFLLDNLPPRLHLILTTGADPPLPLTRLRAQSNLTELRAADLRFTADETATFLTDLMGLPLSADAVAALEARTEGWIAGLQFAALAMRDRSDLAGFITAFTGSHRFVVDYLAEEVLARQPPHLQTFLLQTAILDRMCGPLCDAVMGIENAELKIEKEVAAQGHSQFSIFNSRTRTASSSWINSSAPICSSCRWTMTATGIATTTCLPSCCVSAWRAARPARPSRRCTAAPAPGSSSRIWRSRPSDMRWPAAIGSAPLAWSNSTPGPSCSVGRSTPSWAGSTRCPRRSAARARPYPFSMPSC